MVTQKGTVNHGRDRGGEGAVLHLCIGEIEEVALSITAANRVTGDVDLRRVIDVAGG